MTDQPALHGVLVKVRDLGMYRINKPVTEPDITSYPSLEAA